MQAIVIRDVRGDYIVITAHDDELELRKVERIIDVGIEPLIPVTEPEVETEEDEEETHWRAKPVIDRKTAKVYKSISDWCIDTELSKSSAYKLLSGEKDEVKGHSLSYL